MMFYGYHRVSTKEQNLERAIKEIDYDSIISKVHELFEVGKVKFDIQWRDKFVNTII